MTALGTSSPCGCGAPADPVTQTGPTGGPAHPGPCRNDDLPVNPFLALRVAFGMLLGEDDFRVLMGNPRGKQMLHSAWLHGPGVIWGLGVGQDGDTLTVSPGLAVDGLGRELRLETSWCLSLKAWAADRIATDPASVGAVGVPPCPGERRTVEAWVVAEFAACQDRPVPALADPCDVTRRHDDFSRVVESARVTVRSAEPRPWRPYHRVRVLLGLEEAAEGDTAGLEAVEAAGRVAQALPGERPQLLLAAFRRLAAEDATQAAPEREEGDECPPLLPLTEDHASVVLARLSLEVATADGCVTVESTTLDTSVRPVVLPTSTVQELICGLAPALLGEQARKDAGGPRLVRDSVHWSRGDTCLEFWVTKPLAEGSVGHAIEVSSLSDHGRGWSIDEVQGVQLADGGRRVVVDLGQAPAHGTVRVRIRGTGPTPCYGRHPRVPFAGPEGGPPGTPWDGHDAVFTTRLLRNATAGRADS